MTELFIPQAAEWINAHDRDAPLGAPSPSDAHSRAHGPHRPYQRIRVVAHIHKKSRRPYDAHNHVPTLKASIYGLVDALVIPDDTNAHLTGPDPREGDARPHAPGTILTITAD